jgi:hypothetical protein
LGPGLLTEPRPCTYFLEASITRTTKVAKAIITPSIRHNSGTDMFVTSYTAATLLPLSA